MTRGGHARFLSSVFLLFFIRHHMVPSVVGGSFVAGGAGRGALLTLAAATPPARVACHCSAPLHWVSTPGVRGLCRLRYSISPPGGRRRRWARRRGEARCRCHYRCLPPAGSTGRAADLSAVALRAPLQGALRTLSLFASGRVVAGLPRGLAAGTGRRGDGDLGHLGYIGWPRRGGSSTSSSGCSPVRGELTTAACRHGLHWGHPQDSLAAMTDLDDDLAVVPRWCTVSLEKWAQGLPAHPSWHAAASYVAWVGARGAW